MRIRSNLVYITSLLVLLYFFPTPVSANQPVIENHTTAASFTLSSSELYATNQPLGDPTVTGITLYGQLSESGQVDVFSFVPAQDETLPIELVVPAKTRLGSFKPTVIIVGQNLPPQETLETPVAIPLGYDQYVLLSPKGRRTAYFDYWGLQLIFSGSVASIPVTAGTPYFLIVYDPRESSGEYRIKVGTQSNIAKSYQSGITIPDVRQLLFADSPTTTIQTDTPPTQAFVENTNPFQVFDNQVKRIGDIAGYLIYRLTTLF